MKKYSIQHILKINHTWNWCSGNIHENIIIYDSWSTKSYYYIYTWRLEVFISSFRLLILIKYYYLMNNFSENTFKNPIFWRVTQYQLRHILVISSFMTSIFVHKTSCKLWLFLSVIYHLDQDNFIQNFKLQNLWKIFLKYTRFSNVLTIMAYMYIYNMTIKIKRIGNNFVLFI